MQKKKKTVRNAVKQEEIQKRIIEFLVSGKWQPAERLPTRLELIKDFDASSVTIQRALDVLIADGFLRSDGCRGTFVSDYPPHLFCYGLVLNGVAPGTEGQGKSKALLDAAKILSKQRPNIRFKEYHNVLNAKDPATYQQLIEDIYFRRVAGLLFLNNPFEFDKTPVFADKSIPCAAFMSGSSSKKNLFALVNKDNEFFQKSIDFLCSKGCRKVALLLPDIYDERTVVKFSQTFIELAKPTPLKMLPYGILSIAMTNSLLSQNIIKLLLSLPDDKKPDSLLIIDDNIVANIVSSLEKEKVNLPEELVVVAQTNFPNKPDCHSEIGLVGVDVFEGLQRAIEAFDKWNRSKTKTRVSTPDIELPVIEELTT